MTIALDELAAADFEALPEGQLVLEHGTRRVALDVIEVRLLGRHDVRAGQPFALMLREAGAHVALPQDTYRYLHPTRGPLDLFTVPIGPDAQGMRYEIIFN